MLNRVIEFTATEVFNIKGRGSIYCGKSTSTMDYMNAKVRIYFRDEIIEGTVIAVDAFAHLRTKPGAPIGLIIRANEQ